MVQGSTALHNPPGMGLPSSSSNASPASTSALPQGFSLPPPVDFDAIRRKQRALQQQQQQAQNPASNAHPSSSQQQLHNHTGDVQSPMTSTKQSSSHRNSPAFSSSTNTTGNTPLSSFPDHFHDALNQFIETNRHDMAKLGGVGPSQASSGDFSNDSAQHAHPLHNPLFQQQLLQMQHQMHPQFQNGIYPGQHPHQPPSALPHHLHHDHPHAPSSATPPPQLHPGQQQVPHQLMHSQPATQDPHHHHHHHHQHAHHNTSTPSQPTHSQQSHFPAFHHTDEQARLLSSASNSFNAFATQMDRQHAAALNFSYIDPSLASCFSDARNAAQTLCDDLRNISASLRSMAADIRNLPVGKADRPSSGYNPSSQMSSLVAGSSDASVSRQPGAGPSQTATSNEASSSLTPLNNVGRGQSPAAGHAASGVEPSLLMSLFNGDNASQDMLNLFASGPGAAEAAYNGNPNTAQRAGGVSAGQKRKETEDANGSETHGDSTTPTTRPMPKALGKHKNRPPIEGVRRESVRYRNRKLLVDMREQLYKWLDTTEFCRIGKSYPSGQNGWMEVPVNAEDPSSGMRKVFKPNFEVGSDLYIANKELLEALIELGVQKVRDRPEAYGMKEGVNARDVVVDVAKDLMDSARHGYRANLKKQQEDEADAKAKSTRYKQQERHRTKVRNREVGAKRLRHPIPDSLLTMGLHSDDAASDQEEMYKMDKEEWRRLRMRKLQSKRGWEALAPRWRNKHLTKAYHIADTLSKSKQMPRWRRDGGMELELPNRLWGRTLPKVIFDPEWLAENREKLKEDPYNVTVVDKEVEGWNDEDHNLSEDTEDELERFEREMTRLNRANRKHRPGPGPSERTPSSLPDASSSQAQSSSSSGGPNAVGSGGPYSMSQHLVERGRSATSGTSVSDFSGSRTHSLEDPQREQRARQGDEDGDADDESHDMSEMDGHVQNFTATNEFAALDGYHTNLDHVPGMGLANAGGDTKSHHHAHLAPSDARSGGLILS